MAADAATVVDALRGETWGNAPVFCRRFAAVFFPVFVKTTSYSTQLSPTKTTFRTTRKPIPFNDLTAALPQNTLRGSIPSPGTFLCC
jgi:hypothetical protein